MRGRMRWRERLTPLLVLGIAFGVLSGGLVPAGAEGPDTPVTGSVRTEFTSATSPVPAILSAAPVDLDVADLRHGGTQTADQLRTLGAPSHAGPAVVDTWPPPRVGASGTGQPPGAVRPVLDVVAPRLGRAPPVLRVS